MNREDYCPRSNITFSAEFNEKYNRSEHGKKDIKFWIDEGPDLRKRVNFSYFSTK